MPVFLESFLRYWLHWPSLDYFMGHFSWAWPMAETFHFIGLCLLVGIVGMLDLRLLGVAKGVPLAPLQRLVPWAVFGFFMSVTSGLMFTLGIGGNLYGKNAYDIIMFDSFLQFKLLFMGLAGINVLVYYLMGINRAVEALGPGDDAPQSAKIVAGASLFLWLGVVYWGRLIPWQLP